MKKIKLTREKVALVDDGDFEYLNQFKWYARKDRNEYYASRDIYPTGNRASKIQLQMHRVIMNCPEGMEVDHIDRNKLNNQKSNLRICTRSENAKNRISSVIPTSGVRGIQLTPSGKYRACINIGGKPKYFKVRDSLAQAIQDRRMAEIEFYGEFASK